MKCYRQTADRLTDEVHSYNPLQLYEGGLKRNSVYVNLKELLKSILRSHDLQGDQQDFPMQKLCFILFFFIDTY